jgi:hypothetical protein
MDKKEFLSKEQCEALSELNYDGDYDFVYHATGELWERGNKDKKERFLPAPLKQQVFRWFREKYGLYRIIHCPIKDVSIFTITGFDIPSVHSDVKLDTYEEAENACIDKLIEIAKQRDNGTR